MFLLYPLPAFSTASLECAHYSRRGFCGGKKKKPETSETPQTECRNAATFVWLPRHYHKGQRSRSIYFTRVGAAVFLP